MARPQVAAGGTASSVESSYEYFASAVEDIQQGVVLQLGGWARCYQLLTVKTYHGMKSSHRSTCECGNEASSNVKCGIFLYELKIG